MSTRNAHSSVYPLLPRRFVIKMKWVLIWTFGWLFAGIVAAIVVSLSGSDTDPFFMIGGGVIIGSGTLAALIPFKAAQVDRHHRKIAPALSEEFGVTVGLEDLYNLQRHEPVPLESDPAFSLVRVPGPGETTYRNWVGIVGPWDWRPPQG